jgi:FAD/FMN-containing dehydrogenase
MIRRHGARTWNNIHLTKKAELADLIDVDNSAPGAVMPTGFAVLKQTADAFDSLIQEARQQGVRLRALGSAWALTDIAVTDGWLINTKLLNGCFDLTDEYFESTYPAPKRPLLALAQCGISINELNIYLERGQQSPLRRAMKTSGIGAGQTVAGAFSGNTHGSAIQFGSTPDFVVGIHLVTGTGQSLWIERQSYPVLNDHFISRLGARLVRNDDLFDAAVVSFGAFGLIAAVAIETDPLYQLVFPPVEKLEYSALGARLDQLALLDQFNPAEPYHYEYIFNPYDKDKIALATSATVIDYQEGFPVPEPMWIARDEKDFALG